MTDHLSQIKQALEAGPYSRAALELVSYVGDLKARLEVAERNLECAKQCALKYLDYLGIQNKQQGLERDMRDPDMVGEELAPKDTK